LTSYKRLSWSQIDGEAAHLVGVAGTCCILGALGLLRIRVLLRDGLGDSLREALIIMLTALSWYK
jgi:hypothetical protein